MIAKQPIRVGIVEDQLLIRDLLSSTLSREEGFEVVISVGTVTEARAAFHDTEVDVALLDLELPDGNGVGLAVGLRASIPNIAILLLSSKDMLDLVMSLPEATRRGWSYISKASTTDVDVLLNAIRATAKGMAVIDPAIAGRSLRMSGSRLSQLTAKQYEVLRYVAAGLNNQAIADKMNLSINSIVNHLTAIYAALEIADEENSRVAATLCFLDDTA